MSEISASFDAFKAPLLHQVNDKPSDDKINNQNEFEVNKQSEDKIDNENKFAPKLTQKADESKDIIPVSFKEPSAYFDDLKAPQKSFRDISDKVNNETGVSVSKPKKKVNKPQINVPLPYKEPDWGGTPPPNFSFEVIKNGTLVSTVQIQSSFLVFGRLEVCNFVFEHPSVSRYHAIVQYCKGDDSHPKGFYLYDLGSTHGTFLNKGNVKPKIYYKLKVGYILKFGGSSRLHIFQGPEEEEEEVVVKKLGEKSKEEEDVCSWGMGEDAAEEEEGAINPFALSTPNEELYIEDPKKTLRGWFEREGYELEYSVEEKGFKTFMCCVRLPIDTPTGDFMPIEASVSGKKKEAVIACALEACRTLDRLGLLRQSHQEGRQRKRKKWEENDYYDSDEDTFYDRTGEIEKRREMRKRLAKKKDVENFESIEGKLKDLIKEITEIEMKLEACAANDALTAKDAVEDSLEMYMSTLAKSANAPTDKFERRKLKLRLIEAEKERAQLERMLDIARPTKLPPVAKHTGIIGKKLKSKLQLPKLPTVKPVPKVKLEDTNEEIEEVESDNEISVIENISRSSEISEIDIVSDIKGGKYGLQLKLEDEIEQGEPDTIMQDETMEVINSEVNTSHPICPSDHARNKGVEEKMDIELISPRVKTKRDRSKKEKKVDVYKMDTTEYCTWTPPSGQSGDGMTHLNAKYGY